MQNQECEQGTAKDTILSEAYGGMLQLHDCQFCVYEAVAGHICMHHILILNLIACHHPVQHTLFGVQAPHRLSSIRIASANRAGVCQDWQRGLNCLHRQSSFGR